MGLNGILGKNTLSNLWSGEVLTLPLTHLKRIKWKFGLVTNFSLYVKLKTDDSYKLNIL